MWGAREQRRCSRQQEGHRSPVPVLWLSVPMVRGDPSQAKLCRNLTAYRNCSTSELQDGTKPSFNFFFFYTIRRCDLRSTRTIWKGRKAHGPLPGFCAPLRGPGRGNETPQPSPRQRSVPGSQHGAPIHPRTRAGHAACLSLLPGPPRNCLQERCRLGSFPQGRVFAFVFVLFRLIVLKK